MANDTTSHGTDFGYCSKCLRMVTIDGMCGDCWNTAAPERRPLRMASAKIFLETMARECQRLVGTVKSPACQEALRRAAQAMEQARHFLGEAGAKPRNN